MSPTHEALRWLALREGRKNVVYKDSLGHLTCGTGHLMTESDLAMYREGMFVPDSVCDLWLEADAQYAWEAAEQQAQRVNDHSLVEPLFHVNYQLGTSWYNIHKKTWSLLKSGNLTKAALEAQDSKWYRQTPTRVIDFQRALLGLERRENYDDLSTTRPAGCEE